MNYYQYFYFSVEDIDKATYNVIKIKDKIIELHNKLENVEEDKKVNINDTIDRLEMSKECIKNYYNLDINL
jgi:D-hexose-6-phosphate mutarotase